MSTIQSSIIFNTIENYTKVGTSLAVTSCAALAAALTTSRSAR